MKWHFFKDYLKAGLFKLKKYYNKGQGKFIPLQAASKAKQVG